MLASASSCNQSTLRSALVWAPWTHQRPTSPWSLFPAPFFLSASLHPSPGTSRPPGSRTSRLQSRLRLRPPCPSRCTRNTKEEKMSWLFRMWLNHYFEAQHANPGPGELLVLHILIPLVASPGPGLGTSSLLLYKSVLRWFFFFFLCGMQFRTQPYSGGASNPLKRVHTSFWY